VISSGARAPDELVNLRYGVDVARRAWCTPEHVANTLGWLELQRKLRSSVGFT
jgi:histidinol phosphatase-like PHP family hydrolase